MAFGHKTGGRRAGTPNRRTLELVERLEQLGCDPLAAVANIASDASIAPELRLRAAGELLPYLYPRRKAVDLSVESHNAPVQELSDHCLMQLIYFSSAEEPDT